MEPSTAALLLHRARELAGFEPQDVAGMLGLRVRELEAYEAGVRAVPASVLAKAAAVYASPGMGIPDRVDQRRSVGATVVAVGNEHLEVAQLRHDNRSVLQRYVAAVRRQRGITDPDPVELRDGDVAVLADLLDLADLRLERDLMETSGSDVDVVHRTVLALVLSGLALFADGEGWRVASTADPEARRQEERMARREAHAQREAELRAKLDQQARRQAEQRRPRAEARVARQAERSARRAAERSARAAVPSECPGD
jgi:transcriptional regulator with XRE-family HTH domain